MDSDYQTLSYSSSVSTADPAATGAIIAFMFLLMIPIVAIVVVPTIIGLWKLFKKAGQPGWAAIVPIYNIIVWCKVVGRPIWWVLLFFVPIANIFANLALNLDLAKAFGKDTIFGVLLWLFTPVVILVLAFSKDTQYRGPVAEGTDMFSSFSNHPVPTTAQQPGGPVAPPPVFGTSFTPPQPTAAPGVPPVTSPTENPAQVAVTSPENTFPAPDQNKIV